MNYFPNKVILGVFFRMNLIIFILTDSHSQNGFLFTPENVWGNQGYILVRWFGFMRARSTNYQIFSSGHII